MKNLNKIISVALFASFSVGCATNTNTYRHIHWDKAGATEQMASAQFKECHELKQNVPNCMGKNGYKLVSEVREITSDNSSPFK